MKKIKYILLFIYILYTQNIYSANIEYINPKFNIIDSFLINSDILTGYNPQPSYKLGVYEPYMVDGADLYTATAFCEVLGYTYFSHIMSPTLVNSNSALYWLNTSQWWDFNADIRRFTSIVCDDTLGSGTTGTGGIIINNINNNPGINKSVFDENTLVEIYKYEAIIMVLIVLNTFFMRLFNRKPKPTGFL